MPEILTPETAPQSNAPLPDMHAIVESLRGDLTSGILETRKKAIQTIEEAGTDYLIRRSGDDSLSMRIVDDQKYPILNNQFKENLLWMNVFRGNQKQCLGTDMVSSSGLDRILHLTRTTDSLSSQNPIA